MFAAARAGQIYGTEDLIESTGAGDGDSVLAVLADAYRAFHADGEVITTHRRVLDALTHADLGVLAAGRGDADAARRYAAEVRGWSAPRGLQRLLDAADRIEVRIALAEADYEAAYRAAICVSPPGRWPLHNIHEVGEDMLDLVEAALRTGRLDEAGALTAEAVRRNLAEISPRVAALTMAMSATTATEAEAGELYRSALALPGI